MVFARRLAKSIHHFLKENEMLKRIAAFMLAFAFVALTIAPDALGKNCRRGRNAYAYNQYRNGYNYSPYRYRGVASDRYYANRYYNGRNYSGRYYNGGYYSGRRNRNGSTGRAILTVAAPAAIGAGVGTLMGGKKGAVVGALLGGGAGAAYYLLRNRGRRY
jgi:hypothetical protein